MKKRFLLTMTAITAISSLCLAATIHVPGDYPKIQAGIDAAQNGDKILVAAGTYYENINFSGKAIILKGVGGASEVIIDGRQLGSVVVMDSEEYLDSVLDGFTITNGSGFEDGYTYGGGIRCSNNSSPTITNNIITGNIVEGRGAGIYCESLCWPKITYNIIRENESSNMGGGIHCYDYASPTIKYNTITENQAGYGGGISCQTDCYPRIKFNTIAGNFSQLGGGLYIGTGCFAEINENEIIWNVAKDAGGFYCRGGGIYCRACAPHIVKNFICWNKSERYGGGIYCAESTPTILNNIIRGNIAKNYGGGGIAMESSSPVIVDSIIEDNSTDGDGGAIHIRWYSNPAIINNMIIDNSAIGKGGGIYCTDASPVITNNTIHGNSAAKGGGLLCHAYATPVATNTVFWDNQAAQGSQIALEEYSSLTIRYCDAQGGEPAVFVEPSTTLYWGDGMIDSDPLFVDSGNGDYHLTYQSPCRDTGANNAPWIQDFDNESDPRPALGGVDLGADEFHAHVYCTGDLTPGGAIDCHFVGVPGTTPVGLFLSDGVIHPPIHTPWGFFHLAAPWYLIQMGPIDPDGVSTVNTRLPELPPAPYALYMQALIGNELSNLFQMDVQ